MILWGWAAEYTDISDLQENEWWGDWVPDTEFPYEIDTDGGANKDTDGREEPMDEVMVRLPRPRHRVLRPSRLSVQSLLLPSYS